MHTYKYAEKKEETYIRGTEKNETQQQHAVVPTLQQYQCISI